MINLKNINHVCFDLDGTLVNSAKTIYLATKESLKKLNLSSDLPEQQFNGMIGKHFIDIFSELKINLPDFNEFISIYKSMYFDFINTSKLYNGVTEVLDYLINNDVKISLLTTKAQDQAEKIIRHFNLDEKINYTMGRRNGMPHKPSPEPLIIICDNLKIPPSETLIVGDTELDIQCGKNANAKTCGVLYGYRDRVQIENENPDFIITELNDLIELNLG